MKDHESYNNQLFSRWAPVYDGFEVVLSGVRDSVAKEINPIGKSVLDVATGTGSLAIALSSSAKKVVGIDLSSKMLNVAQKKKANSNLSFLQMDASNMAFQDNEFDVVTISLGLHDMPVEIRKLVLKEVKRVLSSDGKLYILDYDLPQNKLIGSISSSLINIYESKYYLDFIKLDLSSYLNSLGFKLESKANYLFNHLQLLTLSVKSVAQNNDK